MSTNSITSAIAGNYTLPQFKVHPFFVTFEWNVILQNVAYFCLVYQSCRSGMSVIGPHFGLPVDVQRDASRPSMARSIAASMPYKALWTSTGKPNCFYVIPLLRGENSRAKAKPKNKHPDQCSELLLFLIFWFFFLDNTSEKCGWRTSPPPIRILWQAGLCSLSQ